MTVCICNEIKYLKEEIIILDSAMRDTKVNVEVFNVKLKIHNNLQYYSLKFLFC